MVLVDEKLDMSPEDQLYPRLHQKSGDQHDEGGDSPLFCLRKTSPRVLFLGLGLPT